MTTATMTETGESTNVIPFKNIGVFIEELASFAGRHDGLVSVRQAGPEQWFAAINFTKEKRSMEEEGDSMNGAVLQLWRAAHRQFGKVS